jgi:hypothetical protein
MGVVMAATKGWPWPVPMERESKSRIDAVEGRNAGGRIDRQCNKQSLSFVCSRPKRLEAVFNSQSVK